ncbi:MAG: cytochrome P450 [Frankiaceae bacterium]
MTVGTDHDLGDVDLTRVDLLDPGFHASEGQHRVWAALRSRAPLHRQELPDGRSVVSVTRYDDACRVLGSPAEFTSERGTLLHQLGRGEVAAGRMLVATDPPRHTELRRPLARLFSGRAAEAMTARIEQVVRFHVDRLAQEEPIDLAAEVADLPVAVAATLMDLPREDWSDLAAWTAMAASPDDPGQRVRNAATTLAIAHHELFEYFNDHVRRRRRLGGDDLIHHLMTMTAGASRLTQPEVVLNCYSVLLGATATTPHAISGTVLALAQHPDQYRTALRERTVCHALVEEGLRWTSPANGFLRHAGCDVEIAGGRIARDDAVAVWIGAANRDESAFADASRFDVTRRDNRHIAFGHGPHYCLGAAFARLTLRAFFDGLLSLASDLELVGQPVRLQSTFVAGHRRLMVRARRHPRWIEESPCQT